MAARARLLTLALADWVAERLVLAQSTGAPRPRWPPTKTCVDALERGRMSDALKMLDDPGARYVIAGRLRPSLEHLFLARDEVLEREVVIKLIFASSSQAREAVVREATLTAKLHHPNVVTIHEVDVNGCYLVLERLDADMSDLAGVSHKLLLDAFIQAGRGLAAAHARGICHGDFRADNVLVHVEKDRAGVPIRLWAKVADFGQAKVVGARHLPGAEPGAGLRGGWELEDQRAFARALWECLTQPGRPLDGEELMPRWLHAVLGKALMSEPSQRWADMTALVDAIERGRETTAAPQGPAKPAEHGTQLIEQAMADAEDGAFSMVEYRWERAREAFEDPRNLGQNGFALAAVLFTYSTQRATVRDQRRGYRRCVNILAVAIPALEAAGDRHTTREAKSLAVKACEVWKNTYPTTCPQYDHLTRLVRELQEHD